MVVFRSKPTNDKRLRQKIADNRRRKFRVSLWSFHRKYLEQFKNPLPSKEERGENEQK